MAGRAVARGTAMRLLIVTQAVDREDRFLGFFHAWIDEFAKHAEQVTVICLREGSHSLPDNVMVRSLGKETGSGSKLLYSLRFIRLIWSLRTEYDSVFVHMNEEYLLLGGALWRLLSKPASLWRNHYAGSFLTALAAAFATRVFYTSRHSYTARFKKAIRMPVGVETALFAAHRCDKRPSRTILHLSRISPSKRIGLLLEALGILKEREVAFSATIAGSALPEDKGYLEDLINQTDALGLADSVTFVEGVPHAETAALFGRHQIFVNCAASGMLDKTLFEAAAAGSRVLAASRDWAEFMDDSSVRFTSAQELAVALESSLERLGPGLLERQDAVVSEHSLPATIARILAV